EFEHCPFPSRSCPVERRARARLLLRGLSRGRGLRRGGRRGRRTRRVLALDLEFEDFRLDAQVNGAVLRVEVRRADLDRLALAFEADVDEKSVGEFEVASELRARELVGRLPLDGQFAVLLLDGFESEVRV